MTGRWTRKTPGDGGGLGARALIGGLAAVALTFGAITPAHAELAKTGPVDPGHGFPYWYEDGGTDARGPLRLDLCLNPTPATVPDGAPNAGAPNPGGGRCLTPFELPEQRPADLPADQELRFPDYFPAEAFWWTGEASMPTGGTGSAHLVLAMEAAFANEEPKEGDQMSFGRIRIRVDDLIAGEEYKVTHPYGADTYVAEPVRAGSTVGEINVTEDIGCFPSAINKCNFDLALGGRVGPFLTWDTFGQGTDEALMGLDDNGNPDPGQPDAYVGDPDTPHAVVGSPLTDAQGNPQNYFKVEGPDVGGPGVDAIETNLFSVTGKVATPQVGASVKSDVYNKAQEVSLIPSDPSLKVYYTTNEDNDPATGENSDPADPNNPDRQLYTGQPITVGEAGAHSVVTLKFVAEDASGRRSPVESETYTVDALAPNVSASPDPAVPGEGPQNVTLSTNEPATIYYTTDGSSPDPAADNPARRSFAYDPASPDPANDISVARSQTIKAIAVDELGNKSRVESFKYTIAAMRAVGPINPQGGFPFWYEDANGTRLDLCLDPNDQMCLQPFEMPDPAGKVSFPKNFPGEAFWWAGDASVTSNGVDASLVMAMEAAFANEEPKEGDQMSFGRVRVRIDGLVAGQSYRVTHPYGADTYVAEPVRAGSTVGEINVTEDIGCFPAPGAPCDWDDARFGRVGPFLTWDTFGTDSPDAPPAGYVGDPTLEEGHRVKGSPVTDVQGNPQNYFKVERIGANGGATQIAFTDLFHISGKLSKLQVGASKAGGTYNAAQDVLLRASDPNATIYYTLDGSQPTTSSESFTGEGTIRIESNTTLRYFAVGPADASGNSEQSQVYTEDYVIDVAPPEAPTGLSLAAASNSGDPSDTLTNDATPTFTGSVGAAEAGSTVEILANGVVRGTGVADAEGNFNVTTGLLRSGEYGIAARATDAAGNVGALSGELPVTIDTVAPAAPAASPAGGSFSSANAPTVTLSAEQDAEIRYTTDGSDPTGQSTLYGGPFTVSNSQTISAIAIDRAGNKSPERSWTYVINSPNTAPTITNLAPAPGSSVRDRTPRIAATVRDAQTDLARANIQVFLDGRAVNFTYDRARDLATFTPRNNLAFGSHSVRIVATDAQGLRTPRSWTFRITRP